MNMTIRATGAALFVLAAITLSAPLAHAAYPPGGTPGSPAVLQGTPESMSWSGAEPSTPYHGELHSAAVDIGTTVSDSAGNLSVSFSTAGLEVGGHTVTETAPDGSTLTGSFQVLGATGAASTSGSATSSTGSSTPSTGSSTPSTGSSGGLAFTGAKVGGLVAAALLLFAIGFVALRSGRQRKPMRN